MTQSGREIVRPLWGASHVPDLRQYDIVRFADLTGVSFRNIDLRYVTFFGCRLNGASFVGGDFASSRFVGCFASERGQAVLFGPNPSLIDLHNTHLGNTDYRGSVPSRWPARVAELAWWAAAGDNVERHQAVLDLGETAYSLVAPFLASLLDDEEWDVRLAVMQALKQLRGDGFPDDDDAILRAAFEALGDENSLVSMNAVEFMESVAAPLGVLTYVIGLTQSSAIEKIVVGLRAVVALCRAGDPRGAVANTFTGGSLLKLLQSPAPVVRAEYLHALGAANLNIEQAWVAGLRDEDAGVRARGVSALRLLDDSPPAQIVEPLLQDPVEGVRIEALFTLGHLGDFDRGVVGAALNDPSEQVRQYAQMLLNT